MKTDDILFKYGEPIGMLASELRAFLLDRLEGAIEVPDNSLALLGYGYGTGYKDLICTILLSKKGIKLGFNKGTELPDPKKLLTGTGKVHRYVEIKSSSDINNPALDKLMKAALDAYNKRKK